MQQPLPVNLTGSDGKNDINQFLLFITELDPVHSQENQHGMRADTLIPIHKGMIAYQAKAKLCRFGLQRRIHRLSAERLKRRGQCGFQRPSSRIPSMPPNSRISAECKAVT